MKTTLASLLIIGIVCAPLSAQDDLDPKTAAALAKKQEEVSQAESEFQKANLALQDRYSQLQGLYEKASVGADKGLVEELARVLETPLKAGQAIKGASKSKARRRVRVFRKGLAAALAKAEHPLIGALSQRIVGAAEALLEQEPQALAQGPAELARRLIVSAFPAETPFHQIWNENLADTDPAALRFRVATQAVKTAKQAVEILLDPKLAWTVGAPEGMARIPSCKVTIQSTFGFKRKKRTQGVLSFYMDLREVSQRDYWSKFYVKLEDKALKAAYLPRFTDSQGDEIVLWFQDPDTGLFQPPPDQMDLPVTGISLEAAAAYAKSQGKRLPTEAEWIAAGAYREGKWALYPWGKTYKAGLANDRNAGLGGPAPVDSYKEGRSAFGIYNLSGNVREWLWTSEDGKDLKEIPESGNVAMRGGGYADKPESISLRWRWRAPPRTTRAGDLGFRCVQDIKK